MCLYFTSFVHTEIPQAIASYSVLIPRPLRVEKVLYFDLLS